MAIIIPYYVYGSLHESAYLLKPYSEEAAFYVLYQLIHGLKEAHEKKLVLADIKEGNLLIGGNLFEADSQPDSIEKITPFRFLFADLDTSFFLEGKKEKGFKIVGTHGYMSPEVEKKS